MLPEIDQQQLAQVRAAAAVTVVGAVLAYRFLPAHAMSGTLDAAVELTWMDEERVLEPT